MTSWSPFSTEQTKPNSNVKAQVSNRKSSPVVRLEKEKKFPGLTKEQKTECPLWLGMFKNRLSLISLGRFNAVLLKAKEIQDELKAPLSL